MQRSRLRKLLRLLKEEPQLLKTGRFGKGLWPVDAELGQWMYWLIRSHGLKSGLEVGAGVGFSTMWMAEAFRENEGKMLSCEYFMPKVQEWERMMCRFFGVQYCHNVQIVPSEFTRLLSHLRPRSLDFVFFDQRKTDYLPHLEVILPYLKKDAFICADNVLSHPQECRAYLKWIRHQSCFSSETIALGAGLEVTRFTSEG